MNDDLGQRMKSFYEDRSKTYLLRREPVIIRIDGKAFHTFTKNMDKPFDYHLITIMQKTAKNLCQDIQGVKLAYVQSDEISLLLTDWKKLDTEAWFDYNLQKIVSVSSSIATATFNFYFSDYDVDKKFTYKYGRALFDSRAFNIPRNEVCNYFIWRQKDAIRNSVQMLAQSNFSHKELQNKNTFELQEMLSQIGINFNELNTSAKMGSCVKKVEHVEFDFDIMYGRSVWEIDNNIPVFTENREYIEELL